MNSLYPVAAIVLVVGLGAMGLAQVMPADDCTPGYGIEATTTDDPATVEFEDLSPEIRDAFEQAVAGESPTVDARAYREELDGEVVRYEGRNYTTQTHSVGDCGDDPRAFVFIGGQLVALLGVGLGMLGAVVTLVRRRS